MQSGNSPELVGCRPKISQSLRLLHYQLHRFFLLVWRVFVTSKQASHQITEPSPDAVATSAAVALRERRWDKR